MPTKVKKVRMTAEQRQQERARKRWVKALRSGKYKQGTGRLCTIKPSGEMEYCCLGVACVEYEKATGKQLGTHTKSLDEEEGKAAVFDGNDCYLPTVVSGWLGLGSADGSLKRAIMSPGKSLSDLTYLNDAMNGKGKHLFPFEKIADIIEKGKLELADDSQF